MERKHIQTEHERSEEKQMDGSLPFKEWMTGAMMTYPSPWAMNPSKIIQEFYCRGKWTVEQQKLYIRFLELHKEQMSTRETRKINKVFQKMSKVILTRTADQCRSHHQKVVKYHDSIDSIINYFKKLMYGEEVKLDAAMTEICASSNSGRPGIKIYRHKNKFRIEVDTSLIKSY